MMPGESPDEYGIEPPSPEQAPAEESAPKPRMGIPRPSEVEPLDLEELDEPPRPSVKDLDVCPNCGAKMRGSADLVCVRCGFDLKTMKKLPTVTGEVEAPAGGATPGELEPLIKPGAGNQWLPLGLAGISALILIVCYLWGLPSLFPRIVASTAADRVAVITFLDRVQAIVQLVVVVCMISVCGMLALAFLAYNNGMRLARSWEDLKLGAIRMLAIAVMVRLVTLIGIPGYLALEWAVETALQLVVFAALSFALFRLKLRDVPLVTGATAVLFVFLWLAAWIIVWAAQV